MKNNEVGGSDWRGRGQQEAGERKDSTETRREVDGFEWAIKGEFDGHLNLLHFLVLILTLH